MQLIQPLYDRFRPFLPRRRGTYRGYVARDDRLLDRTTSRPNYKEGLIKAIEANVENRDICIVGFGRGISSMVAIEAGASSVTAYEGVSSMIDIGLGAFELNDVPTKDLQVHHAVVGDPVDLFGSGMGAEQIPPSELNTKDILVLDCEGAEISILKALETAPAQIIVETHPDKGAGDDQVRGLLESYGMAVCSRPYEPGTSNKSVLVGTNH